MNKNNKYFFFLIYGYLFFVFFTNLIVTSYTTNVTSLEYMADYFTIVDIHTRYFGNEDYKLKFSIDMSGSDYNYYMEFAPYNKSKNTEIFERSLSIETYENQWEDPFLIEEKDSQNFTVSRSNQDNQTGYIEDSSRYILVKHNRKVRCYTIVTEITTPNNISNLLYISVAENVCVFAAIYGNDSFICNLFNFTYFDIRLTLTNSNPEIKTEYHFSFSLELGIIIGVVVGFSGLFIFVRLRRKKYFDSKKKHKSKKRKK